ncbi:MAG: membrane-bound lytic murein transglycosylase A [Yoonia sp.]|jgi:membrane-bound lytic murein transglycosylase A
MAGLSYTKLRFEDLEGWADDNHRAALDVFCTTCADDTLAELAVIAPVARGFFEDHFSPVLIEDGTDAVFTGYYEPELDAKRTKDVTFCHPIYGVPDDLDRDKTYFTRLQIEVDAPLADRRLEIAWLSDPVDLFFLQVQGSGRLRLPDGDMMRVGFGAKNGHPYTSIGKTLIARGVFDADSVSPEVIRGWVHENGQAGRALLWENESYVFFREVSEVPAAKGPIGAMNKSVTSSRSIAVDPDATPLGLPVWIEKTGLSPMNRLMVAQDIGSAIKGAQRADIFFGTGADAGKLAGQVKDGGRMVVLMPIAMVDGLAEGRN